MTAKYSAVKATALVSTYKSSKYIEGCLQSLVDQTLFKAGALEVLVVDSSSPENEGEIVRSYQAKYPNITYLRTAERETLYGAWNTGIRAARGEYVCNANTDDRHAPECIETLANLLDTMPHIDLVYGDVFESKVDNQSFNDNPGATRYQYKRFFAPEVLIHYQFGCQPLWRKSLHAQIGGFDGAMVAAGDHEFNIRFNLAGLKAHHTPKVLGSFLHREQSLSLQDTKSVKEQRALRTQYLHTKTLLKLYQVSGWEVDTPEQQARALNHFACMATEFTLPWHPGQQFFDGEAALFAASSALTLQPGNPRVINNLAVILSRMGNVEEARGLFAQAAQAEKTAKRNLDAITSPGRTGLELARQL